MTNNPTPMVVTEASSDDITMIAQKVEEALEGQEVGPAIMAMLSLVILIQRPNCAPEQLQALVKDTSHYICLALDSCDTNPVSADGSIFATSSDKLN